VICNRYEVIHELGIGGMATVILAWDRQLDRRVAIKLLRTDDAELGQRLFNEARLTVRCQHDNVVLVYEAGLYNGWPYIVLEHLSGHPLSAEVERVQRLPFARAIEIILPVLEALQHIHSHGIVHRDLKPDNIFLTQSGATKLLDFGIAKLLDVGPGLYAVQPSQERMVSASQLTRVGTILGTYPYMSPEQWGNGLEVDQLTDLWACGIVLFELICGHHPLHPRQGSEFIATAMRDIPPPSMAAAAPPDVPPELSAVVDRCLIKDKEQRWQSAAALAAALRPFCQGGLTGDNSEPHVARTLVAPAPPVPGAVEAPHAIDAMERDIRPLPHAPIGPCASHRRADNERPPVLHIGEPAATILQPEHRSLLFVAASPAVAGPDIFGRKTRRIREELERSVARDRFALVDCLAPEAYDLLRCLRRHRPALVYFAGGEPPTGERRRGQGLFGECGGLYVRRNGVPQLVTPTGLQEMFGAAGSSVKLVVLDRSFTQLQAEALLAHVDCVVGTPGTASPDLAEVYGVALFGAIGDCESIATAHRHACAAVRLEGLANDDCPQIRVRRCIDAAKVVLAR
jgi:serine/threonine protein kinase